MSALTRVCVRMAQAIRRVFLLFVPRDVRAAHRAEMAETFAEAMAAAADRGLGAMLGQLWRELQDLVRSRGANRIAPLGPTARRRGLFSSASGLPAWAGWRQAGRSLRRRPAFFVASVSTLAAGTGILTAVFALVDTVVVKPLPYPAADRLVTVYESSPAGRDRTSLVAPARLADWQARTQAFVALSGSYAENVTDTSGAEPERLEGRRVLPRFFDVFAMPPALGRAFTPEEERFGGPGAAVISERFWTRRFARDPAVLRWALTIGGRAYAIVGVVPAAFTGAMTDVWLPAQISPGLMSVREARFVGGIGRLRDDVAVAEGASDLVRVQDALAREHPRTDAGWSVQVTPLKDARIGDAGRGLMLLLAAVAVLWLIALANVIALTLIHLQRRRRELAVRTALGASRPQLIAVIARETILVSAVGTAIGFALAVWLTSLLPIVLAHVPRIAELAIDWRTAAFSVGALVAASLGTTLVPVLAEMWRPQPPQPGGGRTIAAGQHHMQRGIVVFQVALSMVLLGTSTLLVRSYHALTVVDPGFDPAGAITFHVGARWDEDRTRVGRFQQQLLARLDEVPHVAAAGMTNFLPSTGATLRYQVHVEGITGPNTDGTTTVGGRMIGGGYLTALRARLIAGAWCTSQAEGAPPRREAIVNRRFADDSAAGTGVIGRQLRVVHAAPESYRIVGVVADLAEDGPGSGVVPYVYTCDPPGAWPDPEYVVLTAAPGAFAAELREIVRELDAGRAIFGLRPVADVVDAALDRPRFDASAVTAFAAAAVLLAATGIYSLFSLVVADSRRAIAIRIALGAGPGDVLRQLVTGAGRLFAIGLVAGVGLSLAADRLLRSLQADVRASDPISMATAALVLMVVTVAALLGPARRALRTSPTDALRLD